MHNEQVQCSKLYKYNYKFLKNEMVRSCSRYGFRQENLLERDHKVVLEIVERTILKFFLG
jgi:hypothetical protein